VKETRDRKIVRKLIDDYGEEFVEKVWPKLPGSEYGNLESMVLYCFLRHYKPKYVLEVGTEVHGRTTHIVHKALLANGEFQKHIMSDLEGKVEKAFGNLCRDLPVNQEKVKLLSGVIQQTFRKIDLSMVDFLLIDADHQRDFATFYLDELIPPLEDGTYVHIHDVNLSGNWSWRPAPDSEVEEFLERRSKGRFPLKKLFWLEDWCINLKYVDNRNKINERFPFIGSFSESETGLPYSSSASYWEKLGK